MITVLACAAAATFATSAQSQSGSNGLVDLLSGKTAPVSLRLKDLDSSWRRVVIRSAPKTTGNSLAAVSMGVLNDHNAPRAYFTQGRTVEVGGKHLMIAYAPPRKPLDTAAMMNLSAKDTAAGPDKMLDILVPAPTPDTLLDLALIDLSTVAGIEGVRPFDLAQATSERFSMSGGLATMGAVLFPVFAQARLKAQETSSVSNLKQVALGIAMYTQDYDEVLPPMKDAATMKRAVMPYIKNDEIFKDPRTGEAYHVNPAASKKPLARIAAPAEFVILYEASPSPDGKRAVAYVDGHVKRLDPAEWERAKRQSGMP